MIQYHPRLIYNPPPPGAGVAADSLTIIETTKPPVSVLGLLHGLHDVSVVVAKLNLGMENAIKQKQQLDAKYWLRTHDEVKIAHDLVANFLKRVEHTLALAPGSHPSQGTRNQSD